MRVLIVGCGYVGTVLGSLLAREGHSVLGVRRTLAQADDLRACSIQPLAADATDLSSLNHLPSDCDWVVYCASASGGGLAEYRHVYVEGNRNLAEWLSKTPIKKFVYTSSTGVYGQDDGSIVDETSETSPSSETGRALVEAEQIILRAAQDHGFPGIVLRLAGIYGPGRGYWLKQFLAGEARLEGDGSRILNMIHRDDAAAAVRCAFERGQSGGVYNVVDNEPVSQRVMFQWLARKLGRNLPPSSPSPMSKRAASNKAVSNRRLVTELSCRLMYPTFREGFTAELQPPQGPTT